MDANLEHGAMMVSAVESIEVRLRQLKPLALKTIKILSSPCYTSTAGLLKVNQWMATWSWQSP